MNLSETIKKIRKEQNITQAELSEKTHIPRTTLGSYERGDQEPTASKLVAICNVLNITPNELLNFEFKADKKKKIKELCKNCGINVDFKETEDGIIASISYSYNLPDYNQIHKLTLPLKTLFEIVDEAHSSSQYYIKMKSILIDAFERFKSKPVQIKNKESQSQGVVGRTKLMEDVLKQDKTIKKQNEELIELSQKLEQIELYIKRVSSELKQQKNELEKSFTDLKNNHDD